MSQVQVTLTFANAALAAAFMSAFAQSQGSAAVVGNPQPSAAPIAATAPTAAAVVAAAPAPSAPASLDFDRDVLPAVQKLHGANQPKFTALMAHYGLADVNALKAASDKWAEIVGHCNA